MNDIRDIIKPFFQNRKMSNLLRFVESLKYANLYVYNTDKNVEKGSKRILESLNSGSPQAIGKLGSAELAALRQYLRYKNREDADEITSINRQKLFNNAGVYPNTLLTFERYCDFMLSRILPEITQLIVWFNIEEANIAKRYATNAKYLPIGSLEPFTYDVKNFPWTKWLKNKNVLVIHPFKESIEQQYAKKNEIWKSKEVLPDFNLKIIKPPLSPALVKPIHNDWFESLEDLKEKMNIIDFDVALIGAGAYSLPLAVHAKKLGKHGLHIGGALQIYFGIFGNRWEKFPNILKYKNEFWIRPLREETPLNISLVENGCYW